MNKPPFGLTAPAKIVRVIDGDTVEVEVIKKFPIRLEDCWAPESRTSDRNEKRLGEAAKQYLKNLIEEHGKDCVVHISSDGDEFILDSTTMGRAVGVVWLFGDINLNEAMVDSGHCFSTKAELMATLSEDDACLVKQS